SRVLRWCCSVHKSSPQTLKLRKLTGKNNYVGIDFVGVREHESVARSKYKYENYSKKQKGQYSHNSILEWTSAEIWLYIYANNLIINETYKKGNSRAGCLLCPMGGEKGDALQYLCYQYEIDGYVDIIKRINARDLGNPEGLKSYITSGGWNARKNGRDLNISTPHYQDEIKDGALLINITNPATDWREWIKTLGDIPFEYNIITFKNGYTVSMPELMYKEQPAIVKIFKQIFKKAAHCVGCRVCETNCRNGCISFDNGLKIEGCLNCGHCHEIDDGCLVYHSLKLPQGGKKMKSINSFANHAPKLEWVRDFFEKKSKYWSENNLGPNQIPMFKRFLRESGLLEKNEVTKTTEIIDSIGWESESAWGIILSNFAYNPQCEWYIKNLEIGRIYTREIVSNMLVALGVNKNDATSIINAFKRLTDIPLGTNLHFGYVTDEGDLVRTKCTVSDPRVVLYGLFKFAEKCNDYKEFTLSTLLNDGIDRDGISPTRIFGLNREDMTPLLIGLSAKYPEFITASFTHDLEKITLAKDKTSSDVLELFKGENANG
ncbi:MAG: phosphoadenosine phosphosulfate reductase family protein, partial [Desulfamplus sp.]|nr:phosphoadenosine phosphosulfate reductase family protein [Desulfamplus sp.]